MKLPPLLMTVGSGQEPVTKNALRGNIYPFSFGAASPLPNKIISP